MSYRLDRLTVLVVDDNRHMLTLIYDILRGFSMRNVIRLTNAADAFKEMQIRTVDLAICDYSMEPLSGIEFTQLLRTSKDSPDRYLPIIMVTGYSDKSTVTQARDAGVTEFLAKPIAARGLYARILEVINHPRPFVRTKNFFGPDRRRRLESYDGPERRCTVPIEAAADNFEAVPASQLSA